MSERGGRRTDAEILSELDECDNAVTRSVLKDVCVSRLRDAEQEKAELIDFIRKVLDAGDWYIGALEIDPYRQNPADGEELEAEGRALLAKHDQQ